MSDLRLPFDAILPDYPVVSDILECIIDRGFTDTRSQIFNTFNIYDPISCSVGEPRQQSRTQVINSHVGKTMANGEPCLLNVIPTIH